MGKDSFIFYRDWFDVINDLPDDERLKAYDAVMRYAFNGEICQDKYIKAITILMTKTIDRNNDKFDAVIEKRREAGRKGGLKRVENLQANQANQANATFVKQNKQEQANQANQAENVNENVNVNENENDIEKKDENKFSSQKKYFRPPSIDEVEQYCRERGNGIDADAFVSFYESKGWMIGKNKMKDWRAAVRTWERKREPINIMTNGITTDSDRRKIERAQRDAEAVAIVTHLLDTNTVDTGAGGRTEEFPTG